MSSAPPPVYRPPAGVAKLAPPTDHPVGSKVPLDQADIMYNSVWQCPTFEHGSELSLLTSSFLHSLTHER
jgi:hypothetical protein